MLNADGSISRAGRITLIRPELRPFLTKPFDHSEGAAMYGVPLSEMSKDELIGCCIVMAMQQRVLVDERAKDLEALGALRR